MGTVPAPLAAATRQAPPVPRTDLRPRGSGRRGLHRGDLAVAGGTFVRPEPSEHTGTSVPGGQQKVMTRLNNKPLK